MNKKISDLAAASTLTGAEYLEVLQGGVNKKMTVNQMFVDGETPTGDIDDINTDFVLANTPVSGSVKVFLNGIRQTVTTDYTISGATITFVTPPTSGDIILTDYRK